MPEWLEVWALFLQVHARVVQQLAADMEANEHLALNWFDVLIQLSFIPDGQLRMHDLSSALMLTRSGLTRRIDRMEEAGLVRRADCADDARGVVVTLTAHGRARLREAATAHAQRIDLYFGQHLNAEEMNVLGSAFRRILAPLDASS